MLNHNFLAAKSIKRIILCSLTMGLVVGISAEFLAVPVPRASAYGMSTQRSINLSNANANASGVTYTIQFTPSSSATIAGLVVDFCSNSPDIGQVCNAPTNFSVGASPVTSLAGAGVSAQAANYSGTGWRTLILTYATPSNPPANTPISFTLSGVSNPSLANTTFFARILTYSTAAAATAYTDQAAGTAVDEGSVAISTGNNVNIGFAVQESLTFCVFTNGATSCAGASGNSINLGDTHGVLSSAGPYVDTSMRYIVASNAVGGVGIYLKGDTLKNSGGTSISAINPASASAPGTSQFGLCTYRFSGTTLVPVGSYGGGGNCSTISQSSGTGTPGGAGSATWYLNTSAVNGTMSTYGDEIASLPAPDINNEGVLVMMANVPNYQKASVYTTNLNLVAVGTY